MKKSAEIKPPGILYFFLKIFIRKDMKSYVLGDFDEAYLEVAEVSGKLKADLWYRTHFFRSLPKIILDTAVWRLDMFKSYATVALRNMARQKVFSLINIFGMSIALMVCLWIFLFIKDEFSYDRFHENGESIYSVIKTDHHFNNKRRYIDVNTGPDLKKYFSGIKYAVRYTSNDVIVRQEDKLFQERCHFADADFFKMFSFKLNRGDAGTVLESENSVVITENLARKYFGHGDPVGKILTVSLGQSVDDYTVSGVTEDVPSNSFLQFKMIMNIKRLNLLYGPEILTNENWPHAFTFIQLKKGVTSETIEAELPAFLAARFEPLIAERKSRGSWIPDGPTITLGLQSLGDIHFHSQGIEGNKENQFSKSYILAGIGLMILFIACINFTNLSIGRVSTRTVEIGMRRLLGAGRKNLIHQFWSESVMIVSLSMICALAAGSLLLPFFNRLANKNLLMSDILSVSNLALFGGAAVLIGLLSGSYPGAVLSRIQPVVIIRGVLKLGGKNLLTRLLVVVQFTASVFLVVSTLTLSKQIKFIHSKDLGYHREGVLIIDTFGNRNYEINEHIFDTFEDEAKNLPFIKSVSGCVFPLSEEIGDGKLTYNGKKLTYNFTAVHYNFFDTMGIKFIAGKDFPRKYPEDIEAVVVTESFVNACEIMNPVGAMINPGTEIIGVVEDIHFWNLKEEIRPTIIRLDRRVGPRNLLVRIDTDDIGRAIAGIKTIWEKIQPNKPFNYTFEDQIFQDKYAEEKRWSGIAFFSSFFAVMISCMGLIGVTLLSIGQRVKEIGVRRILGAPVRKICTLLIREYVVLVSTSNLIAWPLGYFVMNHWLSGYAYRANMDAGIFLTAGFLILAISAATIGLQVYRAVSANPVKLLRFE